MQITWIPLLLEYSITSKIETFLWRHVILDDVIFEEFSTKKQDNFI